MITQEQYDSLKIYADGLQSENIKLHFALHDAEALIDKWVQLYVEEKKSLIPFTQSAFKTLYKHLENSDLWNVMPE